ncbi:MAG: slipin family protein [Fimbriimonadaceae bacterium]|nr:slipin family protein [Fimbriimonadaceae bacterium]
MFGRRTFIVMEHQEALLFHNGKLVEVLNPGKHARWGKHWHATPYDKRIQAVTLGGQELMCADGISVRASARAEFRIADVAAFYRSFSEPYGLLYAQLQEALREVFGPLTVEDLMASRAALNEPILAKMREASETTGVEFLSATVRDLNISGEIKRAYGQTLIAQKEAQAALERARGETAALRSLANAAKMMESNPNLLQLRWIHAVSQAKGSTIVVSASGMGANAGEGMVIPTGPAQ